MIVYKINYNKLCFEKKGTMKVNYDKKVDAVYIKFEGLVKDRQPAEGG
jgi:hypothetical protein